MYITVGIVCVGFLSAWAWQPETGETLSYATRNAAAATMFRLTTTAQANAAQHPVETIHLGDRSGTAVDTPVVLAVQLTDTPLAGMERPVEGGRALTMTSAVRATQMVAPTTGLSVDEAFHRMRALEPNSPLVQPISREIRAGVDVYVFVLESGTILLAQQDGRLVAQPPQP